MNIKYILAVFLLVACKTESSVINDIAQQKKELLDSANSFYKTGEYENAVHYYTKLIDIDSTIGLAYFRRAYSYAQIYNYPRSISDYLKAINFKVFPKDTYFNLGCDYAAILNDSSALYYFEKAYSIDPNDSKIKARILELKKK
jgi:tetratricopeptide (TPR) repeat protein